MYINTEKVEAKDFEPFHVIITVEDVIDLGLLDTAIDTLKKSGGNNSLAIYLQNALNSHFEKVKENGFR